MSAQLTAESELLDARESLFRELRNLARIGSRGRGEKPGAQATLSGVVDGKTLTGLASGDFVSTSAETVAKLIVAGAAVLQRFASWKRDRKTVLILELAQDAHAVLDLNQRLQEIFGYRLNDAELTEFYRLQTEHRRRAAAISRIIRGEHRRSAF
jgi:PAS domain-containing protein